ASSRRLSRPSPRVLRAAGASVSLLAPTAERLRPTLTAVDTLDDDRALCDNVVDLLTYLLPADPGDGSIALRPDPVADHLLLAELPKPQAPRDAPTAPLLHRLLDRATEDEQLNATITITRAPAVDQPQADPLATDSLHHAPDLWRPALAVAGAIGGPYATALTTLARTDDNTLPWAELSKQIPMGHSSLRDLALAAAQ